MTTTADGPSTEISSVVVVAAAAAVVVVVSAGPEEADWSVAVGSCSPTSSGCCPQWRKIGRLLRLLQLRRRRHWV